MLVTTHPLISVIVPCYNYGHFLNDCSQSLLRQSYSNWECIIIDDGSTDNAKEIAEIICANDKRFNYFFQEKDVSSE